MSKSVIKSFKFHSEGVLTLTTDVSSSSKEVYSCSVDDSVGIWKKSEDNDKLDYDAHNCLNKCQSVIAVYKDDIYVGETAQNPITKCDQQVVVRYEKEGFEASAPLLTFSLEVTALALSFDAQYLVAGSNDFVVKCLHLSNIEKGYDRYQCEDVIVNVSIDPKCVFFSISTANGVVQFRTIEKSNSKTCIAQFKACPPFSHISCESPRMQVVWPQRGDYVLIPAIGGILVINTMQWFQDRILNLPETGHETYSVTTLSKNGEYLASCTLQGTLVVWKVKNFQLIYSQNIKFPLSFITSLVFSSFDNSSVIAAYSEGYLGTVINVTNGTLSNLPNNPLNVNSKQVASLSQNSLKQSFEEENIVNKSLSRVCSGNLFEKQDLKALALSDDVDDLFGDEDSAVDLGQIKSQYGFNDEGVFVGSSIKTAPSSLIKENNLNQNMAARINDSKQIYPTSNSEPCTTLKRMKIPKTFIVGSTPFNQNQRYLMWNSFGTIRSFRNADESTIEIIFHDATIHSEIIIDNTADGYVYGDLNTNLVALASNYSSDKESKIYVHHISSWDMDSRIWMSKLSGDEDIEAICVGNDFVVVFTSLRFIRLFSAAGTQRIITSFPGSLVTVCAWDNLLIAVRSSGGVIIMSEDEYEHQLLAEIYEVCPLSSTRSIFHKKSLPLCLGVDSRLDWISFTNCGRLVTMDNDCTVRLYSEESDVWTPILVGMDLLKEVKSDYLWPIAVLERPTPSFRYVYCRGSKYPSGTKSIIPTTIPWNIPVIESESERSKLESQLVIGEMIQSMLRQTSLLNKPSANELSQLTQKYAANLVKLFALSFSVGRECRAVELAYLTTTSQGIQVMCNYAAKKERPNLSEKIALIGRERILAEEKTKNAQKSLPTLLTHYNTVITVPVQNKTDSKLVPNPVRLKRKLNVGSQEQSNSAKSANPFAVRQSDTFDEDTFIDSNPISVQPPSTSLEESQTSNTTFDDENFFDCTIDVSATSDVIEAKNPFKRSKINDDADKTWKDGIDFFDQLSKNKKSRISDVNIAKASKVTNKTIVKGVRQSKLLFDDIAQSSESNQSLSAKPFFEVSNNKNSTKKKQSGFDLWSTENKSKIMGIFTGDQVDFQLHLVQQFRALSSNEKKKWNEQAKLHDL